MAFVDKNINTHFLVYRALYKQVFVVSSCRNFNKKVIYKGSFIPKYSFFAKLGGQRSSLYSIVLPWNSDYEATTTRHAALPASSMQIVGKLVDSGIDGTAVDSPTHLCK